jgi:hypothetical protein
VGARSLNIELQAVIANDFFAISKIAGCASVFTTFSPGEVERAVGFNVANLSALSVKDQTAIWHPTPPFVPQGAFASAQCSRA